MPFYSFLCISVNCTSVVFQLVKQYFYFIALSALIIYKTEFV